MTEKPDDMKQMTDGWLALQHIQELFDRQHLGQSITKQCLHFRTSKFADGKADGGGMQLVCQGLTRTSIAKLANLCRIPRQQQEQAVASFIGQPNPSGQG